MSDHFSSKKSTKRTLTEQEDGPSPEVDAANSSGQIPAPSGESAGRSRIARTARTLRAEAARALAGERPVLKKRALVSSPPLSPLLTLGLAASLPPEERKRLVLVTDADDRPLLCMPPTAAVRQNLHVRRVAVFLRLPGNRILLRRAYSMNKGVRRASRERVWDIYAGLALVGEAREETALRLLHTEAGLDGFGVTRLRQPEGKSQLHDEYGRFPALFAAVLPAGLYPAHAVEDMLGVDEDELDGLVAQTPELLGAPLLWAAGTGLLFKKV